MNAWIARLLGGTVCTVSVLAMGTGTAHAEEKVSLKVTTQVSDITAKLAPAKVKVNAPAVRLPVKVKATHSAQPRRAAVKVRTGNSVRPAAQAQARVDIGSRVTPRPISTQPAHTFVKVEKTQQVKASVKPEASKAKTTTAITAEAATAPSVKADSTADALNTPVVACVRVNAGDCTSRGTNGTDDSATNSNLPTIAGDGTATVQKTADALVCLHVNGGDCSTGTGNGNDSSATNPTLPTVTGDSTATVQNMADALVCLRVNDGDCGQAGTDGSSGNTPGAASIVPSVIADSNVVIAEIPIDACARINAGVCGTGPGTGNDSSGTNPNLPTLTGDTTTVVGALVEGAACLSINGGDCHRTDGGSTVGNDDPSTDGATTDGATTDGGSNRDGRANDGGDEFTTGQPNLAGGLSLLSTLTGPPSGQAEGSALAHTGSSAAMLGMLAAGLLSMLLSALLLLRRRQQ